MRPPPNSMGPGMPGMNMLVHLEIIKNTLNLILNVTWYYKSLSSLYFCNSVCARREIGLSASPSDSLFAFPGVLVEEVRGLTPTPTR